MQACTEQCTSDRQRGGSKRVVIQLLGGARCAGHAYPPSLESRPPLMPGEAFDGSPWITAAQTVALVLGSLAAAMAGAVVVAQEGPEELERMAEEKAPKRTRIRLTPDQDSREGDAGREEKPPQ